MVYVYTYGIHILSYIHVCINMENKAHLEMIHSSEVLFIVKYVTWEGYAALSYAECKNTVRKRLNQQNPDFSWNFIHFHGISWSFMGQEKPSCIQMWQ